MFDELKNPKIILIYGRPGHGKTTLIKNLLKVISYNHLGIVSSTLEDSYNELEYNNENVLRQNVIDWDLINSFKEREGIKVLVMDDILHIETNGTNAVALRDLFSTSRHFNLYIIVGVQLLKSLSKALRYCCHIFATGSIDDESKELLGAVTGIKKKKFESITLKRYEFLFASITGSKCKLTVMPVNHV